jgi:DNA repair protein RadD
VIRLRDYQSELVGNIRASYQGGRRSPLVVLPTGGGKTFTFAYMSKGAAELGNRVLILVHRRELMLQASRSLSALGVQHGLIAPGFKGERDQVAVASIQTLDRRIKKTPVDFDFVIIDESHHASAGTWARVLSHFPRAKLCGFTATPIRLDGRGLGVSQGGIFDDLICGPSIGDLIEEGHLVPPVVYAYPHEIDLGGVRKQGGDFAARELAGRVDRPTITGCAVDHYTRLSPGEPAIAFCASLDHAAHVSAQFRTRGYTSEVIHGALPDHERQEMIGGLASGRIQVLTSVDLISEGTDVPSVSVGILLRPTASLGLYLQQVGRILRPSPGKVRGLVLDHVGNCLRHGLPDEDREWTLNGARRRQSKDEDEVVIRQCRKCFAVYEGRAIRCPHCGHINVGAETRKEITSVGGELKQVSKEDVQRFKQEKKTAYARAESYQEVLELTRRYGDKPGFAYKYWNARKHSRRGKHETSTE